MEVPQAVRDTAGTDSGSDQQALWEGPGLHGWDLGDHGGLPGAGGAVAYKPSLS